MKSSQALNQKIFETASSLALAEFAALQIVQVWHAVGECSMRNGFIRTTEQEVTTYVEQTRNQHEENMEKFISQMTNNMEPDVLQYLKPQIHFVKGWANKEIPALAKKIQADLVVIGTAGRTGVHSFTMGNTAETVFHQIDCSILTIQTSIES